MEWIFVVIVLFVIAGTTVTSQEKTNALAKQLIASQQQYKELLARYKALEKHSTDLEKQLDTLTAKYSPIMDAEAYAASIKAAADKEKQQAEILARSIVSDANAHARQIAGDAIDARDNALHYQKVAQAMKNIIDGYGHDYIIPARTLLDDLADSYGFSQASSDYKEVRAKIKVMIKSNQAADCEYVEIQRKQTAINFVVDAFNGKAASILEQAKADNFGTLKQKLIDAFTLVNHNGSAFHNAHISQEYFSLRLEELRLACVINEIRKRDIEEQRRIKEQIREEEKARKEIEKALRDAAKEEEMLQKAMDKVRKQLEQANSEQRAAFEAQISELERKYQEAEERNKRAVSMAQQTKSGHVYIISNEGSFGPNVFKIGMTRRLEPLDRVHELSSASVPFPFEVHAMIWSDNAPDLENSLHKLFALYQVNKVNFRKEFFRLPLSEIRKELDSRGLNIKWTVAAETSEYLETLAIEKAIQENEQAKEDWLNHQLTLDAASDILDEPE